MARPRFQYRSPNFDAPPLQGAPDARFEGAPADAVLPDGFFSTTNLPTYVRVSGAWRRPRLPRMDCVIMLHSEGDLVVVEPRKVKRGQRVAVGASEDGREGIYVHAEGFLGGRHSDLPRSHRRITLHPSNAAISARCARPRCCFSTDSASGSPPSRRRSPGGSSSRKRLGSRC